MKINTKVRYGLRIMIELGLHKGNNGMYQKDIAKNQQLSEKYLDPIVASLKASGLINNVRGKKSGYVLAKPMKEISMYDVYRSFEPDLSIIHCNNKPVTCFISRICVANEMWLGLNDAMKKYLETTSLHDVIRKHIKIKKSIEQAKAIDHCNKE